MAQIKINIIAETITIIDSELNKHNDIITQVMKELVKEHVCYVFEPDMENIKTYSELNTYFEKIRTYIQSLFKVRANPLGIKIPETSPFTSKPSPFKIDKSIFLGDPSGDSYRG